MPINRTELIGTVSRCQKTYNGCYLGIRLLSIA